MNHVKKFSPFQIMAGKKTCHGLAQAGHNSEEGVPESVCFLQVQPILFLNLLFCDNCRDRGTLLISDHRRGADDGDGLDRLARGGGREGHHS